MIRTLSAEDRDAWMPLWRGYQAFYGVDVPDAVSTVARARRLDPAEPMGGALAWEGGEAVGLVHHVSIVRPGRSRTIAICRTSSSRRAVGAGAPGGR